MKWILKCLSRAKRKGKKHLFIGHYKQGYVTYWGKSFCYGHSLDLTMQNVMERDADIKGFILSNVTRYLIKHEEERKKFIQKLYENGN